MPVFFNGGGDDELTWDVVPEFAGGQVSHGPPSQLEVAQFAAAVNVDIDDRTATTRRGTERLGSAPVVASSRIQGLGWYDTTSTEYIVAVCNRGLWKYDGAWSAISSYQASDASTNVCFAQLVDVLYMADGTSHLFSWNGSLTTDLGTGGASQPPVGSIVVSHTNRLFLAGVSAIPDALYASAILDGATWSTTLGPATVGPGQIRIGGGEGDPITGLASWDDFNLVVFKRNSIWVVRADPSQAMANWTVTKISGEIGCVSHRSIAQVGNDIWFLSDSGVRSVGRTLATTQREISEAVSSPVQDVIRRINWTVASKAAATFWNNRYMISLPVDGGTEPSLVLVYNTLRQSWSGTWTGWSPLCWAASRANGELRLNFGRADGNVWRWLDYVLAANEVEATYQDSGTAVETSVTTRGMIFNEAICRKSGVTCGFEFHASRATATAALKLDDNTETALASSFATGNGGLTLPFTLPQTLPFEGGKRRAFSMMGIPPFRQLQVMLSSSAGKLAVRSVMAAAQVNTLEIEE